VLHQAQGTDIFMALLLLLQTECSCVLTHLSTQYFKRDKEDVPH